MGEEILKAITPAVAASLIGVAVNLVFNVVNYIRTSRIRRVEFVRAVFDQSIGQPLVAALSALELCRKSLLALRHIEGFEAFIADHQRRQTRLGELQRTEIAPAIDELLSILTRADKSFGLNKTRSWVEHIDKLDPLYEQLNVLITAKLPLDDALTAITQAKETIENFCSSVREDVSVKTAELVGIRPPFRPHPIVRFWQNTKVVLRQMRSIADHLAS